MVGGGECKDFLEIFVNFFAYLGLTWVQPAFYGVMAVFCRFAPATEGQFLRCFWPAALPNPCFAAAFSPLLAPSVRHWRDAVDVGQRS